MWTLKEPVSIVLKRHNVTVNRERLKANQNLAEIILNDPIYSAKYGHLLVWSEGGKPTGKQPPKSKDIEIEVNVKKKPQIGTEPVEISTPSASTSTAPQTDGSSLIQNAPKQESKSQGSGLLKSVQGKGNSKGKK